ncbi:hypothetical protein TNCV_4081371 [Trichonephila clavipes]|nr:hypothetical protein TNCV_4081371 [Trichonephila clavipes]
MVYADKPQTLDHLEDNIRRVIADIRPQMLEKVIENWTSRLDYIRASHGSHMPEIIFKINKNDNPAPYIKRKIARCVPVAQWTALWITNPKWRNRPKRAKAYRANLSFCDLEHKQMFRSGGQFDENLQCLVPKLACYLFIYPLRR